MHQHGIFLRCGASVLLSLSASIALAQPGGTKPNAPRMLSPQAEQLIAMVPAPQPTEEELRQPCKPNREVPANSSHKQVLETHAIVLVGFELWGRKWLPSHASDRCTDHVFLLAQLQRVQDGPQPNGVWRFADYSALRRWVLSPAMDRFLDKSLPLDLLLPVKGSVSADQLALRASPGSNLPVEQPGIWVNAVLGNVASQCQLGQLYQHGEGVRQDSAMAAQWYQKAVDQNDSCAQNNLAMLYESGRGVGKDLVKAHQLYKLAAEQGLAVAQTNVGISYEEGLGIAKDGRQAAQWYERAAKQGEANGEYRYARLLQDAAPELAAKLYRSAAEKGHVRAQRALGLGHEMGWWGLPQDDAQAAQWFRKAADQGDSVAQNLLGEAHSRGRGVTKDLDAALAWFKKAANRGNARAMANLGLAYSWGRGVARDMRQAESWFRQAAEKGDSEGQVWLGAALSAGDGVAQNQAEALRWWRAAADQGSGRAMLFIGRAHQAGNGVPKDLGQARQWFERARDAEPQSFSDAGVGADALVALKTLKPEPSVKQATAPVNKSAQDAEALYRLGVRHYQGDGVPQSEEKGAELHRQAAEMGHAAAQFNYGWAALNGRGVPQNLALARKWLEAAARQGVAGAQHTLARLYETGAGVPRDDAEAARWYRQAADQGDAASLTSLGAMHAQGRGVPQDLPEARRLLSLAQAKGYKPAADMLRLLP